MWPAEKNSSSFVALGCAVFVPCVHRQNYSPLRDDVAVFSLPAARYRSIYGVVGGRSQRREVVEGGWLVGRATHGALFGDVRVANTRGRFRKDRGIADVNLKRVRIRGD